MQGQILGIDPATNEGQISGSDGSRYTFGPGDWKLPSTPMVGQHVDFEASGNRATGIYGAQGGAMTNPLAGEKTKMVAGLLAIFLGAFGAHKFYLGRTTPALIMLGVSLIGGFVTLGLIWGVMSLVGFIEGIIMLTKSDAEFHQIYVVQGKDWF